MENVIFVHAIGETKRFFCRLLFITRQQRRQRQHNDNYSDIVLNELSGDKHQEFIQHWSFDDDRCVCLVDKLKPIVYAARRCDKSASFAKAVNLSTVVSTMLTTI